ncbi:MAG TPA: ATP synthase F1 subunit gamma [Patescibacteria group bacterium]|nr:ATP synthase F1 subunit gamma [Patescibacteria group bacterium]
MANTLALRRRIRTAQNIGKTTRAMQMIAASRLKKAQHAAVSARPYVEKLTEVTQNAAPKELHTQERINPYLKSPFTVNRALYLIIAPDKGLCGGLITNLVREYMKIKNGKNAEFITIGKKVEGPVAASKQLIASFPFGTTLPSFALVPPLVKLINEEYLGGKVDSVMIISTKFESVFSQMPIVTQLLPVMLEPLQETQTQDKLFEPSEHLLLPLLLQRYVEMVIYQQLLESYASENAARMIAMQNATNNAKDIVNEYQLLYNKARQEKITNEILDISSASVALSSEE